MITFTICWCIACVVALIAGVMVAIDSVDRMNEK